jgi:Protein of unknown function (DUF3160)
MMLQDRGIRMRRILAKNGCIAALIALLVPFLLLMAPGCGGGGDGAIKEIVLSNQTPQDSFALYYPVSSSSAGRIPAYQVSYDLSNVAGMRDVAVPAGMAGDLAVKGFAVTPAGDSRIYQVYQGAQGGKFVTVDAVLHAFQVLRDHTLQDLEGNQLLPDLERLVTSLYDTVSRMYHDSSGTVLDAASWDLAFLGVAAQLLGLEVNLPPEVRDSVDRELKLIADHSINATSPIFGYWEDYTQYTPSGHYAIDSNLERYFLAMIWLGRMGFYLRPGTTPSELAKGRNMTRQAIILVGALHMGEADGVPALQTWDHIYQPTTFMTGVSSGLDVYIYTRLAGEVFGRRFSLSRLADDAAVDEFIDRAMAEWSGSSDFWENGTGGGDKNASFHLLGERIIPDKYIFQQLAANEVADRLMPRGLDVPAAFGSNRALEIMDQSYGDTKIEGYSQNMQELRKDINAVDPLRVHSSLYLSMMETLRVLLKPVGDGYPSFMHETAWQDRDLYTFLGSWSELRHDTVFDRGQDQAAGGAPAATGAADAGYVEPRPEAFARLAAMADMLRRGLSDRGLASPAAAERLDSINQLLLGLKGMAEKELRNEPLTAEEYQFIAGIGDTLQYLEGTDSALALVTDAYTNSAFGEVLEAAVGRPVIYYVIAPVEGKPTLTVGAGFSYYEFIKPVGESLNDGSWRGMLDSGQIPAPPAWTTSFLQ